MPRYLVTRRSAAVVSFVALALASCTRAGSQPPTTPGAQPYSPQPYAPTPVSPFPPGPPAARGWACASDVDVQCPFAHCIGGACGGCLSDGECKVGNQCLSTPMGLACGPRLWAPPNAAPPPNGTARPYPAPMPQPTPTPTFVPTPQPTVRPTPSPSSDPFANARLKCVTETNAYRARLGLTPLAQRPDKEACSDTDAHGDALTGNAHGGSGKCGFFAQNECPGWPGAPESVVTDCLKSMFEEGPGEPYSKHGHYINMTKPSYRGVACGFYRHTDGKLWVVQNFF